MRQFRFDKTAQARFAPQGAPVSAEEEAAPSMTDAMVAEGGGEEGAIPAEGGEEASIPVEALAEAPAGDAQAEGGMAPEAEGPEGEAMEEGEGGQEVAETEPVMPDGMNRKVTESPQAEMENQQAQAMAKQTADQIMNEAAAPQDPPPEKKTITEKKTIVEPQIPGQEPPPSGAQAQKPGQEGPEAAGGSKQPKESSGGGQEKKPPKKEEKTASRSAEDIVLSWANDLTETASKHRAPFAPRMKGANQVAQTVAKKVGDHEKRAALLRGISKKAGPLSDSAEGGGGGRTTKGDILHSIKPKMVVVWNPNKNSSRRMIKRLDKALQAVGNAYKRVEIIALNEMKDRALVNQMGLSEPSVSLFRKGEKVDTLSGVPSRNEALSFLNENRSNLA